MAESSPNRRDDRKMFSDMARLAKLMLLQKTLALSGVALIVGQDAKMRRTDGGRQQRPTGLDPVTLHVTVRAFQGAF
ncbi:MAG TPA: hypothetical protein VGS11_10155 [Candidatus Bathyarchaeia archaeon]|nr:hypothetical protein [Candidatus Bathyarchaeia archaeon]